MHENNGITAKPCLFHNNILIRLTIESNVVMSMTKMTNYVHFE